MRMKIWKKFLIRGAGIILPMLLFVSLISAATVSADESLSLSVSGKKEVGSTITVSATISGAGPYSGFDGSFSYDSNILSLQSISAGGFEAGNFSTSSSSFNVYNTTIPGGSVLVNATFSCIAEGTSSISCNLDGLGNMDGNEVPVTGASTSVSITKPVPLSSNAALSSLAIAPGTLTPSFSSDTYEYSAQVDAKTTKITVSAAAMDAKASVSLNGVQNKLVSGKNTVKVTVKAEDGSTRVYSIVVTRADGPTPTPTPTPIPLPLVSINGKQYTIMTAGTTDMIPVGFTSTSVKYSGVSVPALRRQIGGSSDPIDLTLLYLAGETDVSYFVYEPLSQVFSPYVEINTAPKMYTIAGKAPDTMIPLGYEPFDFNYNDKIITAYRLISDIDNPQVLLFLLDDQGVSSFYYFDQEQTLIFPYKGQVVLLTPTPAPSPSPSVSPVETTLESSAAVTLPANEIIVSDDQHNALTFASLLEWQNPVVLVFYFFVLLTLALLIACIVLIIKRKTWLNEEQYDEENMYDQVKASDPVKKKETVRESVKETKRETKTDTSIYTDFQETDSLDTSDSSADVYSQQIILGPQNKNRLRKSSVQALEIPDISGNNLEYKPINDKKHDELIRPGNLPLSPADDITERPRPIFGDPDEE